MCQAFISVNILDNQIQTFKKKTVNWIENKNLSVAQIFKIPNWTSSWTYSSLSILSRWSIIRFLKAVIRRWISDIFLAELVVNLFVLGRLVTVPSQKVTVVHKPLVVLTGLRTNVDGIVGAFRAWAFWGFAGTYYYNNSDWKLKILFNI